MTVSHPVLMVYVTAANQDDAEKIAARAVQEKVAACANLLGPITSIYEWKGTVERSEEWAMLLKTTEEKFPALELLIKTLHGYEVPCIVAWRIDQGSPAFLDWVRTSVS
jgi:periplasmic divalent cation tolerance protein